MPKHYELQVKLMDHIVFRQTPNLLRFSDGRALLSVSDECTHETDRFVMVWDGTSHTGCTELSQLLVVSTGP